MNGEFGLQFGIYKMIEEIFCFSNVGPTHTLISRVTIELFTDMLDYFRLTTSNHLFIELGGITTRYGNLHTGYNAIDPRRA